MAYINFKYAFEKGLNPLDILTLQTIRQQRSEDLEDVLAHLIQDDKLEFFEENKWIEIIKGKKSDSEIAKLRTTKSGNKLLDNIETAEVDEDTIKIFDWLSKFYKDGEEKFVGNAKRTKQGLAQFSKETGISRNHLAYLLQSFLDSDDVEYSFKLENLLFSSKNLYSRKFSLDECRLHTFYLKSQKHFDNSFLNIKN